MFSYLSKINQTLATVTKIARIYFSKNRVYIHFIVLFIMVNKKVVGCYTLCSHGGMTHAGGAGAGARARARPRAAVRLTARRPWRHRNVLLACNRHQVTLLLICLQLNKNILKRYCGVNHVQNIKE